MFIFFREERKASTVCSWMNHILPFSYRLYVRFCCVLWWWLSDALKRAQWKIPGVQAYDARWEAFSTNLVCTRNTSNSLSLLGIQICRQAWEHKVLNLHVRCWALSQVSWIPWWGWMERRGGPPRPQHPRARSRSHHSATRVKALWIHWMIAVGNLTKGCCLFSWQAGRGREGR